MADILPNTIHTFPRVGVVTAMCSAPTPHTDDGLFSVAPMMDYTDRFMRFLLRRLTSRGTLYTEMVTANTLVHCDESELERFLGKEQTDGPTVFQLGGSEPEKLELAAAKVAEWGYDAINLNCGCPSDRVAGKGAFGASLMRHPDLVADCCAAIATGGGLPVSVKCRIGITEDKKAAAELDEEPVYAELAQFVQTVHERGGVDHFVVHARRAVLGGLSPDANRKVPPLRPQLVHRLAADFPELRFSVNGGLEHMEDLHEHLLPDSRLSGVMVGRAVMSRPWHWATVDTALYGEATNPTTSRRELLHEYAAFAEQQEARLPQRLRRVLISPCLNLFAGEPMGKKFRAQIDNRMQSGDDLSLSQVLLGSAEAALLPETLDMPPGMVWNQNSKLYEPGPYFAAAAADQVPEPASAWLAA